jgi:hypothetical protein
MNSHDRRVTNRYWAHGVYVYDYIADECFEWLNHNFGSCSFKRRYMPRWCWRPDMVPGPNFSVYREGVEIFFHKKEDYAWFMLKWNR